IGQVAHRLLGVVDGRQYQVFERLDVVGVDRFRVDLDGGHVAGALRGDRDEAAAGGAGHLGLGQLRLRLGHLLLHLLRLLHELLKIRLHGALLCLDLTVRQPTGCPVRRSSPRRAPARADVEPAARWSAARSARRPPRRRRGRTRRPVLSPTPPVLSPTPPAPGCRESPWSARLPRRAGLRSAAPGVPVEEAQQPGYPRPVPDRRPRSALATSRPTAAGRAPRAPTPAAGPARC